jgi:hypothetical protein
LSTLRQDWEKRKPHRRIEGIEESNGHQGLPLLLPPTFFEFVLVETNVIAL